MTVVVEQTAPTDPQQSPQDVLARWHSRLGAFALDVLPGIAVVSTLTLVSFSVPAHGAWWWTCVCVIAAVVLLVLVNRLLLPAITGWSLGRAVAGVAVSRPDGEAVGPWRLLLRDIAHLLDTASLVGWL